jgi:hypothetical protein
MGLIDFFPVVEAIEDKFNERKGNVKPKTTPDLYSPFIGGTMTHEDLLKAKKTFGRSQKGLLEEGLFEKSIGFLGTPYEDWLERFTTETPKLTTQAVSGMEGLIEGGYQPTSYEDVLSKYDIPEEPLTTKAIAGMEGLIEGGYQPTSYEDYLTRFTPGRDPFRDVVVGGYEDIYGKGYGMEDYQKTEQDYLDLVTRKYGEAREEEFDPLRERYIAEGLFESGPGFEAEREFREETALGKADIAKEIGYEGLTRRTEERKYQDALKRGDLSAMYNLALSEEQAQLAPKITATELANVEKQYYDALSRGDIETATNMGQILRTNKLATIEKATDVESLERTYYDALSRGDIETAMNMGQILKQNKAYGIEKATGLEFGAFDPASTQFQTLTQRDLQQQKLAALTKEKKKNLGGLGSGLGMLAGGLLALPTGGMSVLAGAAIGGAAGGGVGSMIEY